MYHFSLDSTDYQGYTLVVHSEGYPYVSSARKMAAPVRFLTSNKEFNELTDTNALRKKVESFWLERTNDDKERAKELIGDFYKRVEYANQYFSCHQEGWQTDRGMIYLIFGAPEAIFKSESGETWNYGDGGGQSDLSFTFSKVGNPFSNNDYRLSRSPSYKTYWYSAVEAWRMGRAYAY
jgi:GWxTD domain-containing protein